MSLLIRDAVYDDFEDVFPLFKQLWPDKTISETEMVKVYTWGLESDKDFYLCAEKEGRVIGFCAFAVVNNFWQEGIIAYIYTMIVDEGERGQGIGSGLINEAALRAASLGCKKLELDSGFQRERAHKFYERCGFNKRAFLFSKDL